MSDWQTLFSPPAGKESGRKWVWRVLRRQGHDLLVLPAARQSAAQALTLYAAQTRAARWGKAVLRAALAAGLPTPLARVEIEIPETDPLLAWLQELSCETSPPSVAILAGNPFARGRRFIVLALHRGEPTLVAKLGAGSEARGLVEREVHFLESVAGQIPHLPRLRGAKRTDLWSGLALDFIAGRSPSASDTAGMLLVLRSWLDSAHPLALETLPPWQRLTAHPTAASLVAHLGRRLVAPTIFHGDFAPWNVRVEKLSGQWTVIDWERGQGAGVPGWDWFHWMIHVSVLVHRHSTPESVEFLGRTLLSPDFQQYAEAAQIEGLERELLAGYLIYLHEFIVPAEIKETIARLRDAFVMNPNPLP